MHHYHCFPLFNKPFTHVMFVVLASAKMYQMDLIKSSFMSYSKLSSVTEIMSEKEVVTITVDSGKTAQDVADLMVKKKVGSVIVMDKNSQYHGIITERDLVKRVCLKNM